MNLTKQSFEVLIESEKSANTEIWLNLGSMFRLLLYQTSTLALPEIDKQIKQDGSAQLNAVTTKGKMPFLDILSMASGMVSLGRDVRSHLQLALPNHDRNHHLRGAIGPYGANFVQCSMRNDLA